MGEGLLGGHPGRFGRLCGPLLGRLAVVVTARVSWLHHLISFLFVVLVLVSLTSANKSSRGSDVARERSSGCWDPALHVSTPRCRPPSGHPIPMHVLSEPGRCSAGMVHQLFAIRSSRLAALPSAKQKRRRQRAVTSVQPGKKLAEALWSLHPCFHPRTLICRRRTTGLETAYDGLAKRCCSRPQPLVLPPTGSGPSHGRTTVSALCRSPFTRLRLLPQAMANCWVAKWLLHHYDSLPHARGRSLWRQLGWRRNDRVGRPP